jgi:hypothetical protein
VRKQEATQRRLRLFLWLMPPLAASGLLNRDWTPVVALVIGAIGCVDAVDGLLLPAGGIAGASTSGTS